MTRQQSITIAQVECKIVDAERRRIYHLDRANAAMLIHHNAEFDYEIKLAIKAKNDVRIWKAVLASLNI